MNTDNTIKVLVEFEFPESYEAYFSRDEDIIEAITTDDFNFKIIKKATD